MEPAPPWWFAAAAAAMVVVALLFVLPRPWRVVVGGLAHGAPPRAGARWRSVVVLLALPALAAGLYLWLGDPAALNSGREELSARLRAPDAPPDAAADAHVRDELQRHLRRHPDDARAWVLQARLDMRAQRFEQAALGYERALRDAAKTALDAGVWVEYAEAVGMRQGGTLAGEPRRLVDQALSLNPDHPQALDLAGSAAWEAGEFALVVTHWRRLLAQIPEGSPRHVQLASALQRAEQRARFALPGSR